MLEQRSLYGLVNIEATRNRLLLARVRAEGVVEQVIGQERLRASGVTPSNGHQPVYYRTIAPWDVLQLPIPSLFGGITLACMVTACEIYCLSALLG